MKTERCAVCGHAPADHHRDGCDESIRIASVVRTPKGAPRVVRSSEQRCGCVLFVREFIPGVQEKV